jgi:hypothetical protein
MLGHLMEWFYSGLGGIRQTEGSAYENILIAPEIVGDITHAEAIINTINGKIVSLWKTENNSLTMKVRIPVNCKGRIEIPQSDPSEITESGLQLIDSKDILHFETKGDKTICEISSGEYIFMTPFIKQN